MQNPLAKQDRIEQDFDGRFYLIRKVSKSKDFLIDSDEGGRSRIQILQARILRKIRKRLLLGCSIRFYLAKWSNMWSSSIFTAIFGKEKSSETLLFLFIGTKSEQWVKTDTVQLGLKKRLREKGCLS